MPGLVPGIHVFYRPCDQDVDGRDNRGHDGKPNMHDIKSIRDNPAAFDAALKRRGLESMADHLNSIEGRRLAIIRVLESWRARRKVASEKIHQAMKAKDEGEVQKLKDEVAECKISIATLETEQREVDQEIETALAGIPNLPLDDVPEGVDEHGNVQRHVFGAVRNYAFAPKAHFDLGEAMGFMDFEAAAKLSGARFVVLKKGLARLERAIGQFMLDLHTNEHGYMEVNPPLLVRDDAMFGTGQLPKFEDDQFWARLPAKLNITNSKAMMDLITKIVIARQTVERLQNDIDGGSLGKNSRDLNLEIIALNVQIARHELAIDKLRYPEHLGLIPTAEVPLTNLVRESILDEKELPMRLTALTPCFRAEAGAAGRDTRGMIRQHQFTKVELVSITTPENSKDEHERMLACAEEVLRRLDLHYRVMTLCAGDMGFAAQKTYDIEVWMPGQGEGGAYREISSCSVCGDFQARRMDARYRGPDGKPHFVHTLNGSGTAVGRALIAVMETYQQEDGSIAVPEVLQPYMGGVKAVVKDG
jgi:seryl-tRNA synthetase